MGNFKETLGINEMTSKKGGVWKALLAEYIGCLILNLIGCLSVVTLAPTQFSFVLISLTFGLVIFIIVHTLGHVSGAHVNPAVTIAMLATRNIKVIKAILYIISQMLGSLTGSAILKALTPESLHETDLGLNKINPAITVLQGFGIEFFMGFILLFTVFGVCDPHRHETKPTGALAIGLAVVVGHLSAIDFTGSSMNPARTFGSAVIAGKWEHHWVYWAGPILGGIAAGLLYHHVFAAPPAQITIHERYITVNADEKELKRLDGAKEMA